MSRLAARLAVPEDWDWECVLCYGYLTGLALGLVAWAVVTLP
jgi:hypothetical protein